MSKIEYIRVSTLEQNTDNQIEKILKDNNFIKTKETKYATEYRNAGVTLYVANNENNINLVIDPDDLDDRFEKYEYKIYHSTALTNFPKRMNNGKKPIQYGYKFDFDDETSIRDFIKLLL